MMADDDHIIILMAFYVLFCLQFIKINLPNKEKRRIDGVFAKFMTDEWFSLVSW